MTSLKPLETLYEVARGDELTLPLPDELAAVYGQLRLPERTGRPYVIGNFITTLDGVASLNLPDEPGGGDLSGFNKQDRLVMGLLRATADVVIVGAGTLRALPNHIWTAEHIYRPLAGPYKLLRTRLGKPGSPLTVIVTEGGEIDLSLRVFRSTMVPVLIVTTTRGAQRLREQRLPASVQLAPLTDTGPPTARAILAAVGNVQRSDLILIEGGPRLMGQFLEERCLDQLFLTLSPQIAGRDGSTERPGLVTGRLFAPERPLWGTLVGVKRGGDHLFLRYSFQATA